MSAPRNQKSQRPSTPKLQPTSKPQSNTRRAKGPDGAAAPPSSKRKRKMPARPAWLTPKVLRIAAGAAGLLLLVAFTLVVRISHSGGTGAGADVVVELPSGLDADELADLLFDKKVVRSAPMFAWYMRIFGDVERVEPGVHLLTDNLEAAEIDAYLTRSADREKAQVTIPEGFTRFQIGRRLQEKHIAASSAFLQASTDAELLKELGVPGESAEGYLFPATYRIAFDTNATEIVRLMKSEFDRRIARIKAQHPELPGAAAKELGWGLHEVVTLASVVEREAAVDDERPLVASAFINRFRDPSFTPKPPKLQSDATTAYGCLLYPDKIPTCANFNGVPTPAMNADATNPYSTYARPGLPPGPVCNPGEKSLEATVAPADTHYLYFVGKGGGRHTFSATLQEHNAAVKQLRELKRGP